VIPALRIADSGLRPARENLSITEALCRRHGEGLSPDTLRFQSFPRSAIIGRHQRLESEVNLPWVEANGIATARRMTGGGAIVMGPGVLGWELIVRRDFAPDSLGDVSRLFCSGVAQGLRTLGVDAAYRPRNDVEVAGRKVCGTGGYFDGRSLVFQGTVLIDLDVAFLTRALRLPAHKLGKRGLATLAERVTSLSTLLGEAPSPLAVATAVAGAIAGVIGADPVWDDLTPEERGLAAMIHDSEIGTDAFVNGTDLLLASEGRILSAKREMAGATIEVAVKLRDGAEARVDQVMIAGDFFATPPRVIADLEAHLRQSRLEDLAGSADAFLRQSLAGFLGLAREDIVDVLAQVAREVA
jgi:lipoate-protein ligase A